MTLIMTTVCEQERVDEVGSGIEVLEEKSQIREAEAVVLIS